MLFDRCKPNRDRELSRAPSHSTVHTGPYTAPDQLLTEMLHRANRIHIKCLSGRSRMMNLHHSARTEMSPILSKYVILNPEFVASVLDKRQ